MGLNFVCLVLVLWVSSIAAESDPQSTTPLCNVTDTERVQFVFNTEIVTSEHIVTFKGYFPKSTREKYVTAALKNAGVSIFDLDDLLFN